MLVLTMSQLLKESIACSTLEIADEYSLSQKKVEVVPSSP